MKNIKYIILIIGFVITILLTISIILINVKVFNTSIFKELKNYSDIKMIINNLLGFTEIIVVLSTSLLFLKFNQ